MNLCAKCGACSAVCPVYRVTGQESDTARGKLHLLNTLAGSPPSPALAEILSRCLLCGACRQACPQGIDLPAMVAAARGDLPRLTGAGSFSKWLATGCLGHPALLAGVAGLLKASGPLLRQLPADSGLRLKLGLFTETPAATREPEGPPEPAPVQASAPGDISIFTGCLARHLRPEISRSAGVLLVAAGQSAPRLPAGQSCCGLAAYSAGEPEEARRLARRNLEAFAETTGPITTPCASCYSHLLSYPALLADDPEFHPLAVLFAARLRELSALLAAAPPKATTPRRAGIATTIRVFYHDPCHLRFKAGLREAPRQLLRASPGVELVELPDGPRCCGLGGTFNLGHPDLSHRIGASLVAEIAALTPDLVVTSCSGCLLQLHGELARLGAEIRVTSLVDFLGSR